MKQHTPGPWEAAQFRDGTDTNWVVLREGTNHFVAEMGTLNPEADARLAAASPDLLTACRDLRTWLSALAIMVDINGLEQQVAQLDRVITKAEGRNA
jgi:hypothetical protein